jgi:hypothetical protein
MKKTKKDEFELSPMAQLIIDAGELLHGEDWRTKFADEIGISKQLLAFIARGEKSVSEKTRLLVVEALARETERLKLDAARLDAIEKKINKKAK